MQWAELTDLISGVRFLTSPRSGQRMFTVYTVDYEDMSGNSGLFFPMASISAQEHKRPGFQWGYFVTL